MKVVAVISELGVLAIFLLVQLFYVELNEYRVEAVVTGCLGTIAAVYAVIMAYLAVVDCRDIVKKAKAQWSQRTKVL